MQLVENAIDAHGGLHLWTQYNRICVTLSFGGLAFRMKMNNQGLRPRRYIISLDHPMVIIEDFPNPGHQGVFTPDLVWIEDLFGSKTRERQNPRSQITKFPHILKWDNLDLLYFAGYACWNYFNTPFIFHSINFSFKQLSDWKENGQVLRRIEVIYPESLPTHCVKQTIYLDRLDRIFRVDYNPETFAAWARAAHYCSHYRNYQGFWVPGNRTVLPRRKNNHSLPVPELVWIKMRHFHIQ